MRSSVELGLNDVPDPAVAAEVDVRTNRGAEHHAVDEVEGRAIPLLHLGIGGSRLRVTDQDLTDRGHRKEGSLAVLIDGAKLGVEDGEIECDLGGLREDDLPVDEVDHDDRHAKSVTFRSQVAPASGRTIVQGGDLHMRARPVPYALDRTRRHDIGRRRPLGMLLAGVSLLCILIGTSATAVAAGSCPGSHRRGPDRAPGFERRVRSDECDRDDLREVRAWRGRGSVEGDRTCAVPGPYSVTPPPPPPPSTPPSPPAAPAPAVSPPRPAHVDITGRVAEAVSVITPISGSDGQ